MVAAELPLAAFPPTIERSSSFESTVVFISVFCLLNVLIKSFYTVWSVNAAMPTLRTSLMNSEAKLIK